MKSLALAAIALYQRYLSPLKGFACAFRIYTGRDSCSAYGKRVIARYGVRKGLALLGRRLDACSAEHRRHHPRPRPLGARQQAQAGVCDLSCDLPHVACDAGDVCQVFDCATSCADGPSCRDWWRNRRRRNDDELYVRMPPPGL